VATAVYLEVGSKKTFACSLDWPGWCRSAKTEDAALEALGDYAERYAPVTELAGVRFPPSARSSFDVVERMRGTTGTDFGVPELAASADRKALTKAQAERLASLVDAAWAYLDDTAARTPESLRKGPRGGGRDRDKMLDHVLAAEAAYGRKIGVRFPQPALEDRTAIAAGRSAILDAIRAARRPMPDLPKGWPYRYAARRIAWHVLDHAWEMQDRTET
jgi:hypothetical protein